MKMCENYSPREKLLDENFIIQAIKECLLEKDFCGIIEICEAHFHVKQSDRFESCNLQ